MSRALTLPQLRAAYVRAARRFIKRCPHFLLAYKYLLGMRAYELAILLEYPWPKITRRQLEKITRIIEAEERELVRGSLRRRRNPARVVYDIAVRRGFKPKHRKRRRIKRGKTK